jgi:antitoxin HicB
MDYTTVNQLYPGTRGYAVTFVEEGRRNVRVQCAALPELDARGATKQEAFVKAHACLDRVVAERVRRSQDVPPFDRPGRGHTFVVTLKAIHILKVQLNQTLRERGLTRAELSRRLGWHRNQVDRLFDFDHASRLDQIEEAACELGLRLDTCLVGNVEGMSVQVTEDGDGWRVRLATENPACTGEPLTPRPLATEAEARTIEAAVKRALDVLTRSDATAPTRSASLRGTG